ncbi:2-succinyl-5-enolpyruvyl-6-hydroxy-3-cyclohexene-1-carboxylic-acid synthase [Flavimarina sp. Hel_I_48]|uniref:2-succinyl-5-enolpyruvyl-6-hydroxy-3- cyclohexene-1-carboxylic-acid synthase n=1 Tax=Flavimarina sp. Hel_I_48 TaxID=1392488 RepID=UPI0004DF7FCE|nr:2-succinyl-5-enolpyruvyl-6-hydroxy-3-cyclohexene-1-carboxylic-acid synthase [Flavimarina sp. Hel_I_48]
MVYSTIPVAQAVITLCLSKGIDHVVISPGSRNAPLTIGFSHHPEIKAFSIVDERCAAFFALGLAQQLQKPVAICCTSGSALLNYYPAIAEAFYSDIPLVVLSADRPIERIDIGDGQTIRQRNVFENHILYSANLYSELVMEETVHDQKLQQKQREATTHNQQEINKALNTAIEKNGPVHINIPFYEPLYQTTETAQPAPIFVSPKVKKEELSTEELQPFAKIWNTSHKKIVLVGVLPPDALEKEFLNALATDPSVLIFTETTSNLDHPNAFTRIDNLIGSLDTEGFQKLQPDLLVTFGGMVISKKIKAFLRNFRPKQHWHIDPKKAYDTFFCLNRHFEVTPNTFWKRFLPLTEKLASAYFSTWNTIKIHRDKKHEEYLKDMQWCDFKAFQIILEKIPDKSMLQLGNSSTVRYVQLFDIDKSLKVFCNRGTSGIDGSTSTAIGAALGSATPTTLITGDLSFLYDSNALWNRYIPGNFKIIVINNNGGGIFRILPGNKDTKEFTDFFETTHNLTAEHLAKMYDFKYYQASTSSALEDELVKFYTENDKPSILEISTPRTINDQVLLNYFSFIR